MDTPTRSTNDKLGLFRRRFAGLGHVYGSYCPQTGRAYQVKAAVTDAVLLAHLRGQRPYGVYLLEGSVTRAVVADFDQDCPDTVRALVAKAGEWGLTGYIERSKSKGHHCWFFANDPGVDAAKGRLVMRHLLRAIGSDSVEVFPKQDRLPDGTGYGNFINAPLFGRLVPEGRTVFVDPTSMVPFPDQWSVLEGASVVTDEQLTTVIETRGLTPIIPRSEAVIPQPGPGPSGALRSSLPPCARRMLDDGVTDNQRVCCFRLAVHMNRIGLPFDIAVPALQAWARKNQPRDGKEVISDAEVVEQVTCAFRKAYRGFGCQEPAVVLYCSPECPLSR
jgi:hypothetical protein